MLPAKSCMALLCVLITAGCASSLEPPKMGALGSTHIHSDFKVYLNSTPVDFSQDKYQVRSQFIHVESHNGDVIHFHATNEQFGFFFSTVGMTLSKDCFTLDDGRKFCTNDKQQLRMYVNDKPNSQFGTYFPKDCDKILISYGTEAEIAEQLASITERACTPETRNKQMSQN